jgi:hypothetical protein
MKTISHKMIKRSKLKNNKVKQKWYIVERYVLCRVIYQDISILIKEDRVYTWK